MHFHLSLRCGHVIVGFMSHVGALFYRRNCVHFQRNLSVCCSHVIVGFMSHVSALFYRRNRAHF